MFDVLFLMFSWLPSPLNVLCFGAVCIFLVVALFKLVSAIIDVFPFL